MNKSKILSNMYMNLDLNEFCSNYLWLFNTVKFINLLKDEMFGSIDGLILYNNKLYENEYSE